MISHFRESVCRLKLDVSCISGYVGACRAKKRSEPERVRKGAGSCCHISPSYRTKPVLLVRKGGRSHIMFRCNGNILRHRIVDRTPRVPRAHHLGQGTYVKTGTTPHSDRHDSGIRKVKLTPFGGPFAWERSISLLVSACFTVHKTNQRSPKKL
jgi:hypothetical protein